MKPNGILSSEEPLKPLVDFLAQTTPPTADLSDQIISRIQLEHPSKPRISLVGGSRLHVTGRHKALYLAVAIMTFLMITGGITYAATQGWPFIKDQNGQNMMRVEQRYDLPLDQSEKRTWALSEELKKRIQPGQVIWVMYGQEKIDVYKAGSSKIGNVPYVSGMVGGMEPYIFHSYDEVLSRPDVGYTSKDLPPLQIQGYKLTKIKAWDDDKNNVFKGGTLTEQKDSVTGAPYAYFIAEWPTKGRVRLDLEYQKGNRQFNISLVLSASQKAPTVYDYHPSQTKVHNLGRVQGYISSSAIGKRDLRFAQKTEQGLLSYIISSKNVDEDTLVSFAKKIVAEH